MSRTEHERCSEALTGYLDASLEDDEAVWVTDHLDTCPECRAEMAGLQALRGSEESLTEVDRARLHRDVLHELGLMTGAPAARPSPWGVRAAQLLGAAATVALLLGGLVYLGGNLGGGDDADMGGAGDGADALQDAESDAGRTTAEESGAAGGAAPQSEALSKDVPPPEATYQAHLGTVGDRALKQTGRRSRPFTAFPTNVEVGAVAEYRKPFLDDLVAQAPDEVTDQLRECATEVLAQVPTAVATYAAPADYGDPPRAVLIIGFAYSFTEQGFLDQYQMWIYPRGSCDFPTNYIGGRIRP